MNRTNVYIDAANIILSAEGAGFDIDLLKLIQRLKDLYRPNKIIYFTGRFKSMEKLFETIAYTGVEMVYKEIYNENNKSKANCDVEISHRVTRDIDLKLVKNIVLLSGDGDFAHILDFAKVQSITTKVIASSPNSCSLVLKRRDFLKISYLKDIENLIKK